MVTRLPIGLAALAMVECGVASASVTIVALEPIIGNHSHAWSINNIGQVVGTSSSAANPNFSAATRWDGNGGQPVLGLVWVDSSEAYGINDANQVVGGVTWQSTLPYMKDEHFHYLEGGGFALAINNLGTIVGVNQDGNHKPAMWLDGFVTLLPTPGCDGGYARALNDNDVIVGHCGNGSQTIALRWIDGRVTDLGDLGGGHSLALSINNVGRIVGGSRNNAGNYEAFIHDGDRMIGMGTFGYDASTFWAINNVDQVVGYVWNLELDDPPPVPDYKALIYENGHMTLLFDLLPSNSGWTYLEPYDINDHFQIVGYGHVNGLSRGFLMTIHLGDVVGDTVVNIEDLLAVISAWGDCQPSPAECPADVHPLSGDGVVGIADLLEVVANWG